MISPGRRVSYELLCKIELGGLFSDDAANSPSVERLDPRDRRLATELIKGTLRWQGFLDHVLAQVSSRPWMSVDADLKVLLRMSLYQMCRMNRIPDHALVNDAVALSKRRVGIGSSSFINAILRNLCRERPWSEPGFRDSCPIWSRVSLPQWLWERWSARFGAAQAQEYALSLNEPPRAAFRIMNGSKPLGLVAEMGAEASELVPGAYLQGASHDHISLAALPAHFQDEASQLIPFLLGDASGKKIWDACAAPGGKSAVLRELAGTAALTVSSDISHPRLLRLDRFAPGCRRVVLDARKPPPFRLAFDAVLADVPCSGLGTLRRNPEIKWRLKPEDLGQFQNKQLEILESVSQAVRRGGLLLYSTCSTEPEENEEVVYAFLTRGSGFSIIRPFGPSGIERLLGRDGLLSTFPGTRLWDGFFAALMVRNS